MNLPVKIIIAEDEAPLRDRLKRMLAEAWPDAELCGEAENGQQAVDLVLDLHPQVAFLDIKMPGLTGMEVARQIAHQCQVVFVTAFDQFAVEAFEQEAVDYLLKPVSMERLQTTVERLRKRLEEQRNPSEELAAATERILTELRPDKSESHLRWIRAQQKDGVRLVPVESISYFKADEKYTLVITADEEFLIRKSIKELASQLDPNLFWQIHRGTIVNLDQVDHVSRSVTGRGVLKLKGRSELLTVSRKFLHRFKQM
jgi:DNA-binding LytR/AlgR family response regulator